MKIKKISVNMRFSGSVGNASGWKTIEVGVDADLTPTEAKSWQSHQESLAGELKTQLIKLWRVKSDNEDSSE